VGVLVLNHFVPTRFDATALVAELRQHWQGPLILGEDLLAYDLATRVVGVHGATIALG
jgi:ribonuclease Z